MRSWISCPVVRLSLRRWVAGAAFVLPAFLGGSISVAQSQAAYKYNVIYDFCSLQNCTDGYAPSGPLIADKAGNLYGAGLDVFKLSRNGKESVLYTFTGGEDGYSIGSIVRDSAGNIYGTTELGGDMNAGTVWKLDTAGSKTVLYNFQGGTDGENPVGGVIRDSVGNLYGTTSLGGDLNANCGGTGEGCGTVFKLDTSGKKTILHGFSGGSDYGVPSAGVVMDKKGTLYGTTYGNGAGNPGTVYEVTRNGKETVLYTFKDGNDGCNPRSTLILDTKGNLYGTTSGDSCNYGTIFKLTPKGRETVLRDFQGRPLDGAVPYAGVVMDAKGNLYGTTKFGGADDCPADGNGCGTVFKLSKNGNETVFHKFKDGSDGGFPQTGVLVDTKGDVYGTTPQGGYSIYCGNGVNACGAVFKITQ